MQRIQILKNFNLKTISVQNKNKTNLSELSKCAFLIFFIILYKVTYII